MGGVSGLLSEGTVNLNLLTFTAGVNALFPQDYNGVYSINETMTIGGTSQPISIPFNLSISYSDTLTVVGGTTFSFTDAGTLWQVVVNGLTLGPNSGGTISKMLTAQVTDPPGCRRLRFQRPSHSSRPGLAGWVCFPGGGNGRGSVLRLLADPDTGLGAAPVCSLRRLSNLSAAQAIGHYLRELNDLIQSGVRRPKSIVLTLQTAVRVRLHCRALLPMR